MDHYKDFITCSCGTEMIAIGKDVEYGIDLAFFQYGLNDNKFSMWTKLRLVWQIVKTGTPYMDAITLDRHEAIKFRNVLDNLIKKMENVK